MNRLLPLYVIRRPSVLYGVHFVLRNEIVDLNNETDRTKYRSPGDWIVRLRRIQKFCFLKRPSVRMSYANWLAAGGGARRQKQFVRCCWCFDDTHATIHQQPSKLFYLFYADSQNKIIIQRRRTVDHHSRPEYRYWK